MTKLLAGACVLAMMAAACGENGTTVSPSVVGPSSPTTSTSATTVAGRCGTPSAPAGARAVVKGTIVTFTWSAVPDAREYVVAIGTTPGGTQTLFTNTPATTFDWSGVAGSYYARIHGHSRCGTSDPSSEMTFTVQGS